MPFTELECNTEESKLKINKFKKTDKIDYNNKKAFPDRFETKELACTKGNRYFYKEKSSQTKKYKCNGQNCVEDVNGPYTTSNCDGKCKGSNPTPTPNPPQKTKCKSGNSTTGFKNQAEGDSFREFIHRFYPDVARNYDLWISWRRYDNCTIRDVFYAQNPKDEFKRSYGALYKLYLQNPSFDPNNANTPSQNNPEAQKKVFETLIENGQITSNGIFAKFEGKTVYITKNDKDVITKYDPSKEVNYYPVTKDELTVEKLNDKEFVYFVHFPLVGDTGQLGQLVKQKDFKGEKLTILVNPNWKWSPKKKVEQVTFYESINRSLKRALKKKLHEQVYSFSAPVVSNQQSSINYSFQNPQNQTLSSFMGYSLNQTTQNLSQTDIQKINNLKQEAIRILTKLRGLASKPEDIKQIDDAIALLNSIDSSQVCTPENQQKVIEGKQQLELMKSQLKPLQRGIIGGDVDRLIQIMDEVIQICKNQTQTPTNQPTTNQPTTNQPTTSQPTTSQPTTSQPTTTNQQTTGQASELDQLRIQFGFVTEDGKPVSAKNRIIEMDKLPNYGINGQGSLQNAINNGARSDYFHIYNKLIKLEFEATEQDAHLLKYPSKTETEVYDEPKYQTQTIDITNTPGGQGEMQDNSTNQTQQTSQVQVGSVKKTRDVVKGGDEITENNFSGLSPLTDDDSKINYRETNFGFYLGNKSALKIFVLKGSESSISSGGCTCEWDDVRAIEELEKYIVEALTSDGGRYQGNKWKKLCSCYLKGRFDSFVNGTLKIDLSDLATRYDLSQEEFGRAAGKRLSWKEIKELIQTGQTGNLKLKSRDYKDVDFGELNCPCERSGTMNESKISRLRRRILQNL